MQSSMPTMATTITPASPVFLMNVQSGSPDYLKRVPIKVSFEADGGPFGAPNMLSLLPLQGTPLRPNTRYAAVVTSALGVLPSSEMTAIATGNSVPDLSTKVYQEYEDAIASLDKAGVEASIIAGLAVFTTDDPTAQLKGVLEDALAHVPTPDQRFQQTDLYDDYCVYESTMAMPDYQAGASPYTFYCASDDPLCDKAGGAWVFDEAGHAIVQRYEEAGVVVTIPRAPMPASGWPIAHFIRTGGGGNRPLVDRGPEATNGGPPIMPGTGPALFFASAGLAGASVDGPHEDLRNLTGDNEDFLMFNVFNPKALRDNVRESGLEYAVFAHVLASLQLDVSDCPGATSPARFDTSRFALMGHSMGATIAPLTAAFEPLYRAFVLSGSGASWIENVMWKQQPLDVQGAIQLLLGYTLQRRTLTDHDPVLTLFQWAVEPADSDVYSRGLIAEPPTGLPPRHWLMEQGIVDHYILPPIANAMSLSLGLDLLGTPLDDTSPELTAAGDPTLESVLQFSTGKAIALPASGNRVSQGVHLTTVVTQHPSDGVEDGHEMVFQTDAPKREYRCFLQTWAAGQVPIVPLPGDLNGPCE
jgi:pimeloyl-ACP methyl ester carboxylesterase